MVAATSVMDALFMQQVCGQQGLAQGVDQGGALGPADMVALAAAYPLVFIQVSHITDILSLHINGQFSPFQTCLLWLQSFKLQSGFPNNGQTFTLSCMLLKRVLPLLLVVLACTRVQFGLPLASKCTLLFVLS